MEANFQWCERSNLDLSPTLQLQHLMPILRSAAFHRQRITISFSPPPTISIATQFTEGKKSFLIQEMEANLFFSYNGQFKLEVLSISYFSYLFHKLSISQDAYFMKPARIFREIFHHIFYTLGLPSSSERQYWIDSNYQRKW